MVGRSSSHKHFLDIIRAEVPWKGMESRNKDDDRFWDFFLSRLIFTYPYGDGGVCVVQDIMEKRVFWLYGAKFNRVLAMDRFKVMLFVLSGMGVEFLAIDTNSEPRINPFYRKAGLQEIKPNLWAIRLNG